MNIAAVTDTLKKHNQHVLIRHLQEASPEYQSALLASLASVDLDMYFAALKSLTKEEALGPVEPHEVVRRKGFNRRRYTSLGNVAIAAGELGFFVVAGGQGSRLGFEHPKGMFPAGVLSGRSLFQIFFERAFHYGRYYGFRPHIFVMTSCTNRAETEEYLQHHKFFGLDAECVHIFEQGNFPAVDLKGQLILSAPNQLFLAPDGHGGSLTALKNAGMLQKMQELGIHYLSYFQVDNPLVDFCDPAFLGVHMDMGSQVSTKVLPKREPLEKLGCPVQRNSRAQIIEYSDLPPSLAHKTNENGELAFGYGSIGIHLFDVDFLVKITQSALTLPVHRAQKAIPFFAEGTLCQPKDPNGIKLERFVFDAIPLAERSVFFEAERMEEFAPLKNKEGDDSIATCAQGQTACHRNWLEQAGLDTSMLQQVEILPSFACNKEECAAKAPWHLTSLPRILMLG